MISDELQHSEKEKYKLKAENEMLLKAQKDLDRKVENMKEVFKKKIKDLEEENKNSENDSKEKDQRIKDLEIERKNDINLKRLKKMHQEVKKKKARTLYK